MIIRFIRLGGWLALALIAVGAGFGVSALRERATSAALDAEGIAAVATIEGMRTETHRRRTKTGTTTETDHFVTYAYLALPEPGAAPVRLEVEHEVPRFVYEELVRGEEVDIRYLPEEPTRADFFPGETRRDSWFLAGTGAAFAAIGLLYGFFPWRAARRADRLARSGVPAEGTLEQARLWNGRWRVAVRFRDTGGAERHATAFVASGSRWIGAPQGSSVALSYDPLDPSNVALA